jgi:hypothetical protein
MFLSVLLLFQYAEQCSIRYNYRAAKIRCILYLLPHSEISLLTLSEKEKFLNEAADKEYILFLQHDNYSECCTVQHTEKGVRLKETFNLKAII